ncbi:MAG: hypothetical protein O7G30_04385 [Proteobacteria bacterium]|nr:hypothetical protein [Pseudomonadota bacterium]
MSAIRSAALVATLAAVAAAGPAPALGADRGADGRFEKRTSSHFVLYQDVDIDESHGLRGSRRFEHQVLETLEAAYQRLDDSLGLRPRRPLTVVVYDPGVFDARFSRLFRFPAAGFYEGTTHIRGDTVVHQSLVRVLHHELVHAAFDALAPSLALPAWLNEGLAEWFEARAVGKRHLSPQERRALRDASQRGALFTMLQLSTTSFGHFGAPAARLAYLQSYAFVDFLARRKGERTLREVCDDLLRTGNLDRALRRTYRADLSRLEERFFAELDTRG